MHKNTLFTVLIQLYFFTIVILNVSCSPHKNLVLNKKTIVSAHIIEKDFLSKSQKRNLNIPKDYYLRIKNNEDYFIKFCSSTITKNELKALIKKHDTKTFTLEVELLDGDWDICNPSLENIQQSRVGRYVIIHNIIK